MTKWLGIIIALVVIGIGAFFALNNFIYTEKQAGTTDTTKMTQNSEQNILITPISHASMVLTMSGQVIYNDPVGADGFAGQAGPQIILISDIHGDHLDAETLLAIAKEDTTIVVPQAVADMLPENLPGTVVVIENGEKTIQKGIEIEAIPMYNVPESADSRHTKGRGNGYVLSSEGETVYIAGDTSATPEMKALKNIAIAFVPMNLPYTMSDEEAAEGVLAFKPKVVHPYHYRGQSGLSDINKFKELVNSGDPTITVELLNFYPEQ